MFSRRHNLLKAGVLAVSLTAYAAAQGANATPAPGPTPISLTRNYSFPVVGLSGTETLQVNIVNTATAPSTSTATASCTGTVSFLNASGGTIGSATKFSTTGSKISSVPLPFSGSGYSSRGEILATVQQTTSIPSSNVCNLSLSLEIFDTATGVLHGVLAGPTTSGIVPLELEVPSTPTSPSAH